MTSGPLPTACVIGAGCSGITAAKALAEAGIPYEHFEISDRVGGNWAFDNPNGMSSAYETLHINTSRQRMEYRDFPMPSTYPTFPHHSHIAEYFNDYVSHFGLRERIEFNTGVRHVDPRPDGTFEVTLTSGETRRFDAVLVANGHHWDPSWPDPDFPGEFTGEKLHAHDYVRSEQVEGKRVVVVGMGNSALDIATIASYVGESSIVAARRGAHIVPKWLWGRPLDQLINLPLGHVLPFKAVQAITGTIVRASRGSIERYHLPVPEHGILESHAAVSSDFLVRAGHGAIDVRPNIDRFDGEEVVFADGSRAQADLVVYATGYNITFPFFDDQVVAAPDNRIELYRNVVKPDLPGVYFIGLTQPLGAIMPIAERQSQWIAKLLTGAARLPSVETMERRITKFQTAMRKRYLASRRHTIQVDYDDYMLDLKIEMWRGAQRAHRHGYTPEVTVRARKRAPDAA